MQGKLMKYPKIHQLGTIENKGILDEIIVIESKIDGANFRCRYLPEEDKLIFGSRNNELLENTNENEWIAIRAYKKAFEKHKEAFIPNIIYFSESMQKHTISYENIPDTIGYDIFDLERNEFWDWKKAKRVFENIGIPFINIHYEGPGKEITVDKLKEFIKNSPYRKEGDEGVVIKCYGKLNKFGRPLFAKLVTDSFKEENKKVFNQGNPSEKQNNEDKILNTYFTINRFNKAINHFKEENIQIEISLMPKLYKYISEDIMSENILTIMNDYNNIDFKIFNHNVAKRTIQELKKYLLEKI